MYLLKVMPKGPIPCLGLRSRVFGLLSLDLESYILYFLSVSLDLYIYIYILLVLL